MVGTERRAVHPYGDLGDGDFSPSLFFESSEAEQTPAHDVLGQPSLPPSPSRQP
jgi:hypothetical protein